MMGIPMKIAAAIHKIATAQNVRHFHTVGAVTPNVYDKKPNESRRQFSWLIVL